MTTTEVPQGTLIQRATFAYETEKVEERDRQAETNASTFLAIKKFLDVLHITPTGRAFRNLYDGLICVPIIDAEDTRAVTDDGDLQGFYRPAVALAIRNELAWVMAEHIEEPLKGYLLPVGELTGLEVIGQAIEHGGHRLPEPPVIDGQIRRALTLANADNISGDGKAFLAGAEAICIALRDVADAIHNLSL